VGGPLKGCIFQILRRRRLQSENRRFNRQGGRFLLTIKTWRRTALWCQRFISSDKDYQSKLHGNR
jgi:hypothetical protein